jgi:hypothetical protein
VVSKPQVIKSDRPSLARNSVLLLFLSGTVTPRHKVGAYVIHYWKHQSITVVSPWKKCSNIIRAPKSERGQRLRRHIHLKVVRTLGSGRMLPALVSHMASSGVGSQKIPPKHSKCAMNCSQIATVVSEVTTSRERSVRSMMSEETKTIEA